MLAQFGSQKKQKGRMAEKRLFLLHTQYEEKILNVVFMNNDI